MPCQSYLSRAQAAVLVRAWTSAGAPEAVQLTHDADEDPGVELWLGKIKGLDALGRKHGTRSVTLEHDIARIRAALERRPHRWRSAGKRP